jgi:hypothetical protein
VSLLKSKSAIVALGANAIALKSNGQAARSLTSAGACYPNSHSLCEALLKVAAQIEDKSVRFIISNHHARYLSLPWQSGLISREDWVAVAQHAFRTQFGGMAEQWEVRVNFSGYGKPVTACAMDQALIDDLYAIATENTWHITAIEPLWMAVMQRVSLNHDNIWLLQVEPERALLCEYIDGEWQRFSVVNPPAGQEQAQCLQLLTRQLQLVNSANKPKQVQVCAPTNLKGDWQSDLVKINVLPLSGRTSSNSAVWMTEL